MAVFAGLLAGQVGTSTSILGQVIDSTQSAVSDAQVVIKNVDTGESRSTKTNVSGLYNFPSIIPGVYDITVTHQGFRTSQVSRRVVEVAQSAQVDVVLQVGEISQSVTVSGAGGELISTVGADVSGTVSTKLIQDLPLNGHNFLDLAATLPFVTAPNISSGNISFAEGAGTNGVFGGGGNSFFFRPAGMFAAGNRDSATNVSLDGSNIQQSTFRQTAPQQPNAAIQEVRIEISTMNAEFGYGVAAVNVITKSGANELHGELFEYLHNSASDANAYFSNATRTAKAAWRQNQFGGALGGAAIKNKVFFFGAYEGLRIRRSIFTTNAVPPADIRTGDFSNYHVVGAGGVLQPTPVIYDPANYNPTTGLRVPYPGNKIPIANQDPATTKYLKNYVALPNTLINNVPSIVGNVPSLLNHDMGVGRIDWNKSSNARIYGRFSQSDSPSQVAGLQPLQGTIQNSTTLNGVVHWTQIFSAATVNDMFGSYSRPIWLFHDKSTGFQNFGEQLGLKNTLTAPGPVAFGGPAGYNLGGPGVGGGVYSFDNVYQFGDDITRIHGRHSLKFGFGAIERRLYHENIFDSSFAFQGIYTQACPAAHPACPAAVNNNLGGSPFADFMIGATSGYTFQANGAFYRGYQRYYGVYAQDSWRVSKRLTLNYGLRYEYWSPWLQPRHTTATFNLATGELTYVLQNPIDYLDPSKGYGRSAPLTPGVPAAGYVTSTKNFGPRVGLAYMITPGTVFRAGYGIYYDGNINMNQWSDISSSMPPFRLRDQLITSTSDQLPQLYVRDAFPHAYPNTAAIPNANPPFTFRSLLPREPVGTVQEWSASLQHRIGAYWVVELAYQGTHAIHLNMFIDENAPALPQGSLATAPLQNRRRYTQWGIVGTWTPIGYSRYNGGSFSMRNNAWHGMTMSSNFTWAKNLSPQILATSDQGNQAYYAPYIWQGPVKLSSRLRGVTTYSYDLPFGRGRSFANSLHGVPEAVLGGWNFSGILDFTTGVPNYPTIADNSGTSYGQQPNRICDGRDVPGGRGILQWFNTACFVQVPFGTWGNTPFGVFEDPGIANWNVALAKSFVVPKPFEGGRISLRVDMFNALNHTQLAGVNSNVTPGTVGAGTITNTRAPRQVQFAVRYVF